MVCKENVVSWFANLPSYKRIDVMCTLLNMCLPFEIRYLGTCIEDRGKRDYNDLRDTDHHANNLADVMELINISDKRTRRKLVLYIALLHGCNYKCANVIYDNLSNLENQELKSLISNGEDEILEELLLLYTMALNHPAFSYDQKSTFGRIFLKLQQFEELNNQQQQQQQQSSSQSQQQPNKTSGGNCKILDTNQQIIDDNKDINQLQSGHNFEVALRPVAPPGLAMPPPGLCLPTPDISQYVHLGFPIGNSMGQWSGQMVISSNPIMYGNNEVINYPTSPLVSRQSSPSQSRSPSRSNSPKRNARWSYIDSNPNSNQSLPSSSSSAVASSSSSPYTCSSSSTTVSYVSTSSHNTVTSNNTSVTVSTTPITSINRTCLPPRTVSQTATTSSATSSSPPSTTLPTTSNYIKHSDSSKHSSTARNRNTGDNSSTTKDANFKNNLQNCSVKENHYCYFQMRRMSDDDLREIGLTNNAVGQLRNIVRNQTTNGLSSDKKELDNEVSGHVDDGQKSVVEHQPQQIQQQPPQPQQQQQSQQQQHHHHHHHHHHHQNAGMRRYPAPVGPQAPPAPVQTQTQNQTQAPAPTTMDPSAGLTMYHPPPAMFPQNPCYACLTVPVGGVQNRYPRCNAQHMYCLTQLSALRLEENRHYSQSSSSDSTGSRSPPETPPAAPWASNSTTITTITPNSENITSPSLEQQQQQQPPPQPSYPHQSEVRLRNLKKPHMRSKNHTTNGTINPNSSNSNTITTNNSSTITVPSNIPCVSFPGPSQMAFLPPFPLRPPTTIYNSAYHSVYTRSYQPSYQPNGEIIYPPYPSNTPPPPPPPPLPVSMSQNYITTTPILTYTPVQKISCYNCGSHSHLANDCKDQTMEELTKRAQYRLDYSIKQPPDCSDE